MRSFVRSSLALAALALLGGLSVAADGKAPVPVSPGGLESRTTAEPCPTFSWDPVDQAMAHELAVFRLEGDGPAPETMFRKEVAGSAGSWTLPLGSCLSRGDRYAWTVRALSRVAAGQWSAPLLFEVAPGSSAEEVIAVLSDYLDAGGSMEELTHSFATSRRSPHRPPISSGRAPAPRPRKNAAVPDPQPLLHSLASTPGTYAGEFEYEDLTGTLNYVGLGYENHALYVFGDALFNAGDHRFIGKLVIPQVGVTTTQASGANETPEVYQILSQAGCDAERRGAIQIMRPSVAGGQDSLCFCGLVTNDYYWWCFNP